MSVEQTYCLPGMPLQEKAGRQMNKPLSALKGGKHINNSLCNKEE